MYNDCIILEYSVIHFEEKQEKIIYILDHLTVLN